MSSSKIRSVNSRGSARDSRSHEEKLQALYQAFGECKQRAVATGKINECSLNKVSEMAAVTKSYLTGTREYEDKKVSKKYQAVNEAIQKWRKSFKKKAELSAEQTQIQRLKLECKNLKKSVRPLIEENNLLKRIGEKQPEELRNKEEQILILNDKVRRLESSQTQSKEVREYSLATRITRRIISPDVFRFTGGRYDLGDPVQIQKSIHQAYDDLDAVLSRDLAMRLYVTVGLPCSGKSYWAESAELCDDRHPVIFDATNLTKIDRLQLIHQVKRNVSVPICCVVFDTEMSVIRSRNLTKRTSDRRVPDDVLDAMNSKFEKPDPYAEEWIDSLVVVRSNG